jgi:CrcB protein
MLNILYLALGGAIGAVSRFSLISLFNYFPLSISGTHFGIMFINIVGSFAFGLILYLGKLYGGISESLKIFLFTGFLGSFTTYSTFIFELSNLIVQKQFLIGALYLSLSIIVPLLLMLMFLVKI